MDGFAIQAPGGDPPGDTPGATESHAIGELSSGVYAAELIRKLCRRLGKLQAEVLADQEREPLHQLRVNLRRLRTVFKLFGPALLLPEGVSEARLAGVARRTSLTRDLDVLRLRLVKDIAPALPAKEQKHLARALRQLEQDRQQAFNTLVEALSGKRYLKLLARLGRWLQEPRCSPLGELTLGPWANEWLAPITAGVFLEEGWFCQNRQGESLHQLRKRLKAVRYAMESLEPLLQPPLRTWLESLKTAQDHLGDLHDLQVLAQAFDGADKESWGSQPLPGLRAALEESQQHHWQEWLPLREGLISQRGQISLELLRLGQA